MQGLLGVSGRWLVHVWPDVSVVAFVDLDDVLLSFLGLIPFRNSLALSKDL